jgi:hypothetical protein
VYVERVTRVLAEWRFWVALVGTAVAFGVAALVSGTATPYWRAETTIVVGTGAGPLQPGEGGATGEVASRLDDLVRSDQIAANVISGLHLRESRSALLDRISVSVPEPGLLRVRVSDRNRLRAPQIAQQIDFLFPQLVQHRFPKLKAVVWDPPHLIGRTGRQWGRNLGIAAGVSAVLWALAVAPLLGRIRIRAPARPSAPAAAVPAAEPPRAPPPEPLPAPRSKPLPASEPEPVQQAAAAPKPRPPAPAQSEPELAPAREPEPEPEPVPTSRGEWSLAELERLVQEHAADFPDRTEEWEIYLLSIRDHAAPDGQLPATLDWLIWDTFGELLDRTRAK